MKVAPPRSTIELPSVFTGAKPPVTSLSNAALVSAARARAKQVVEFAKTSRFSGWEDMQLKFNVYVPPNFTAQPYSYLAVLSWAAWYEKNAAKQVLEPDEVTTKIHYPKDLAEVVCGAYTLRPRQRKARWQILDELIVRGHHDAVLCPMNTGSGKTIVAASIIQEFQRSNYFNLGNKFKLWNIIYIVPKAVQIKTIRALIKAGITGIGSDVHVIPYTGLRSKEFKNLFSERQVTNPYNGELQTVYDFKMGEPALVILDECHRASNPEALTSRYIKAFINPRTKFLFMSATPAIVPEDLRLFALASGHKFNGERLDDVNWGAFVSVRANANRFAVNHAAITRVFDTFGTAIVDPPADPRKVKSYNGVKLINFRSDRDRRMYENAQQAWLEKCEKFGESPSERGQILVAFTNFRRAAELIAVDQVVEACLAEHAAGRAPIMAVCYKQTVRAAVAEFAKRGIPRSKISIIWGGDPEIKESDVIPLLDWVTLRSEVEQPGYVWSDRKLRAKYNKSTRYHQSRLTNERTVEEQRELDRWTSTMKLHDQTPEQRQDEIDNFQEGRTEFCIFTLSAGGTGIDLDQQIERARPRTMFAMPCYYAEEFVQAFGRAYREFTLTDVYQWVVLFNGTIVTNHVAPRLAKKIACINKTTRSGLELENELFEAAKRGKLVNEPVAAAPEVEVSEDTVVEDDEDEDEE